MHYTLVSKVENGARSPTEDNIRAWCAACGASDQIPDLIATARHIEAMHHEYRRQMQAGLKHLTESSVPRYEQTSLFRVYDTTVVPGLFTTAEYASAVFLFWAPCMGLRDDDAAAVQARTDRQRVLYTGRRQFRAVIEEQVLRTPVGDADIMTGQLDRLLAVMSLPLVSLGIIPSAGERHSLAQGSFWMFDDTRPRRDRLRQPDRHPAPRHRALRPRLRPAPAVGGPRPGRPAAHHAGDPRGSGRSRQLAVNFCQQRCPAGAALHSVDTGRRVIPRTLPGR